MPRYRVIGHAARLNVPDTFGRVIASPGIDISEVPIPLMFIDVKDNVTPNERDRFVAGSLTRLSLTEDGQLEVEGYTEKLEPGCYPCGVDLSLFYATRGESGTMVIASSTLTAVTAYRSESSIEPTFDNAHLHVEPFPPLEKPDGPHWFCYTCFAAGDGEAPRPCPSCGQDDVLTFDPTE